MDINHEHFISDVEVDVETGENASQASDLDEIPSQKNVKLELSPVSSPEHAVSGVKKVGVTVDMAGDSLASTENLSITFGNCENIDSSIGLDAVSGRCSESREDGTLWVNGQQLANSEMFVFDGSVDDISQELDFSPDRSDAAAAATGVQDIRLLSDEGDMISLSKLGHSVGIEHAVPGSLPPNLALDRVNTPAKLESPHLWSDGSLSKGLGMRRWRRLRREVKRDTAQVAELSRMHKRSFFGSSDPIETLELPGSNSGKDEFSIDSSSSVSFAFAFTSGNSHHALNVVPTSHALEPLLASSKDSIATSTLRVGYGPFILKSIKEKRCKPRCPKEKGKSGHRGMDSLADVNKKIRGERDNIGNSSSFTSLDADSRNSSSVFGQAYVDTESENETVQVCLDADGDMDPRQTPRSLLTEVAESDLAENLPKPGVFCDDHATIQNNQTNTLVKPLADKDPLLESTFMFQAAQEALQNEIQKFKELGKEPLDMPDEASGNFTHTDSFIRVAPRGFEFMTSDQSRLEEMEGSSSTPAEIRPTDLVQKANLLEHYIEEARETIRIKDARIHELESILSGFQLHKSETRKTCETCMVIETEFENILRRKVEAEVEYLVLVQPAQRLNFALENEVTLPQEQKNSREEQSHIKSEIKHTGDRDVMLQEEAEKLEAVATDLIGAAEPLKLQSSMYKSALCYFVQFVLLCMVFCWICFQLFPSSDWVAPT